VTHDWRVYDVGGARSLVGPDYVISYRRLIVTQRGI
jgi:hypothetical protein